MTFDELIENVKFWAENKNILKEENAPKQLMKVMEELVIQRLHEAGIPEASVTTSFAVQWNTNMISEKGLQALLKHGLAPPPKHDGYIELDVLSDTPCPLCGSRNTTLKSPFGPTLCRSLHYCNNCKNAFEGFKPVS